MFMFANNECTRTFNTVVTTFDKNGNEVGTPVITPGSDNPDADKCCIESKGKDAGLLLACNKECTDLPS